MGRAFTRTHAQVLKAIPEVEVTAEDVADVDRNLTCAICLDDFVVWRWELGPAGWRGGLTPVR